MCPRYCQLPRTRCDQTCISVSWEMQETEQAYEDYCRAGGLAGSARLGHVLDVPLCLYYYDERCVPAPWLAMLALVPWLKRGCIHFTASDFTLYRNERPPSRRMLSNKHPPKKLPNLSAWESSRGTPIRLRAIVMLCLFLYLQCRLLRCRFSLLLLPFSAL